jgi:hypothetical protein
VLAPWAYLASVAYHDSFWYPFVAKRQMAEAMASDWGRLFANGAGRVPDARGFPEVGDAAAERRRSGLGAVAASLKFLATCLREAPELAARRRTRELAAGPDA